MPPNPLLLGRQSVQGWASGSSIVSQDTLSFSALSGIRSMNEVFPLEQAAEEYKLMISGKRDFGLFLQPVIKFELECLALSEKCLCNFLNLLVFF